MLKSDIVGSAFAIRVFLIIYYVAVGFFPVFFQSVFHYSQSKAKTLGNWFWACNALGLLIIGFPSDKIRVRKPFMLACALGAIVFTSIFAMKATQSGTSYSTFVVILSLLSVSLGVAYAPWRRGTRPSGPPPPRSTRPRRRHWPRTPPARGRRSRR